MIQHGSQCALNINFYSKMNINLLNKRITVYQGTTALSSMLSEKLRYIELYTIYAGVYERSGVSTINQGEQYIRSTEFTIIWTEQTKLINNKFRILYDENWYNVIEVIPVEPRQTLKIITSRYGDN